MIYDVIYSLLILFEKLAFFKKQLSGFIVSLIMWQEFDISCIRRPLPWPNKAHTTCFVCARDFSKKLWSWDIWNARKPDFCIQVKIRYLIIFPVFPNTQRTLIFLCNFSSSKYKTTLKSVLGVQSSSCNFFALSLVKHLHHLISRWRRKPFLWNASKACLSKRAE